MTLLSDFEHKLQKAYRELQDVEKVLFWLDTPEGAEDGINDVVVPIGVQFANGYGDGEHIRVNVSEDELQSLKPFLIERYENLNEFISQVEPVLEKARSHLNEILLTR